MSKIDGPVLLGFSGDFVGAPAKAPAKAPVAKGPPAKRGATIYGPAVKIVPNEAVRSHRRVTASGRVTAKKALVAASKALKAAATPAPAVVASKKALIGAAAAVPPKRALTAKQKQALAKQDAASSKAKAAAAAAAKAGDAAKKAAVALAKSMKVQRAAAVALRRPPATRVRGLEAEAMLGEYYDVVGASPDPNNPGFLDDGSEDPAYFDMSASAGEDPLAGPTEYPPSPPPDAVFDDYNKVGGILYDGSKSKKPGWCGSYSYYNQTIVNPASPDRRYGFVYGGNPHDPSWPGDQLDRWVWVHGKQGDKGSIPDFPGQERGVSGWWDDAGNINGSYATTAGVAQASIVKGYGPIIGNPAWPDFAGMRCDKQGNLFWLPQEAPDWLTFPLRQAAAVTAKAEAEAAAAAKKAEDAAAAKIQSDAALAQAQQDAANALAESAEQSAAAVAQSQQATQEQQLSLEQARADQTQAAADAQAAAQERQIALEQAKAESEQMRQVNQLVIDEARREQLYLDAHPEEAHRQVARQESADGGEDGGDEGYMDDGEAVPGAEIMREGEYGDDE